MGDYELKAWFDVTRIEVIEPQVSPTTRWPTCPRRRWADRSPRRSGLENALGGIWTTPRGWRSTPWRALRRPRDLRPRWALPRLTNAPTTTRRCASAATVGGAGRPEAPAAGAPGSGSEHGRLMSHRCPRRHPPPHLHLGLPLAARRRSALSYRLPAAGGDAARQARLGGARGSFRRRLLALRLCFAGGPDRGRLSRPPAPS
jgi:hypothetical protein